MPGIREEFMVFVLAFISGAAVRAAYKCISCFRMIVPHSLLAMGVEDFFYWQVTAIYLFVQMYHTSDGSIRWYFVLGVVLGAVFASLFIRKLEKIWLKIYGFQEKKSNKSIDKRIKKR